MIAVPAWSRLGPTLGPLLPGRVVPEQLVRAAYYAQHEVVRWPLIALNRLLFGLLLDSERGVLSTAEIRNLVPVVRRRFRELQKKDLDDALSGVFPVAGLFSAPVGQYLKVAPAFGWDALRVVRRARSKKFDDLPHVSRRELPAYYKRCFHWQTDGYLSEHSARLYDLGVEILFTGMGDAMRRQVIPELSPPTVAAPFRREQALSLDVDVLDVGCGTGRLLEQLSLALPRARLTGFDLSEAYVRHARRRLAGRGVRLEVGNAEQLPYGDATFDCVVSVFLFHELPARVRMRVFAEMVRVLRPGGTLVVQDAAQLSDSPELAPLLHQFPRDLHEPFFRDYVQRPLEGLFERAGLTDVSCRPVFVAKLLSARKADAAGQRVVYTT